MRPLTDRQALFVREYLKDLNASAAAIRAGYGSENAETVGPRLVRKSHVRRAIDAALARRAKRLDLEADAVVREIAKVAFANMGSFARWGYQTVQGEDGQSKRELWVRWTPSDDLDPDDLAAVQSLKRPPDGSFDLKLGDKLRALDLLAKHLGLYPKDPADLLETLLAGMDPAMAGRIRDALAAQCKADPPIACKGSHER